MERIFGYIIILGGILVKNTFGNYGVQFPPYWNLRSESSPGAGFNSFETQNMYQCQRLCWITPLCESVVFSVQSGMCTLFSDVPDVSELTYSSTHIGSAATKDDESKWMTPCRYKLCPSNNVCVVVGDTGLCLWSAVGCGTPPEMPYASVTYTTTTYNSFATYACVTGYNFTGSSLVSQCGDDATWTGFNGACYVVNCGTPPDVTNANVTYTTTTYGAEAVYSCETGYNFNGASHVSECWSNGSWVGLVGTCDIVDCGTPPDVTNANVTYTTTTYGAEAVYSCETGHNFNGTSLVSECRSIGSWVGLVGTCDIVTCPAPTDIGNAQMIVSALTYASVTTYTCNLGFHFAVIGHNLTITCLVTGQWSLLLSTCEIVDCDTPPMVTNANVTYTTTTYGAEAVYSCETGHNFNGTSLISECRSNGSWIGLVGTCDIVTCQAPSDIENAQMINSALTYASVTTYTCDPGFHFAAIGQNLSITCLITGQWSLLSSTCENIKDCADILAAEPTSVDGVYMIQPTVDTGMVDVYCDMTGGGWTVIQRRTDGSVNFTSSWEQYRDGFGTLTNEFWLGNTAINRLTNQQTYRLHIHLTDVAGDQAYAEYSSFHIDAEVNKFRLNIANYSGTAGDSLVHYHDTMNFTTYDNDNDESSNNCAVNMPGGWWYNRCLYANLNGQFGVNTYSSGINWESWRGWDQSLVGTVMKIKPV